MSQPAEQSSSQSTAAPPPPLAAKKEEEPKAAPPKPRQKKGKKKQDNHEAELREAAARDERIALLKQRGWAHLHAILKERPDAAAIEGEYGETPLLQAAGSHLHLVALVGRDEVLELGTKYRTRTRT